MWICKKLCEVGAEHRICSKPWRDWHGFKVVSFIVSQKCLRQLKVYGLAS